MTTAAEQYRALVAKLEEINDPRSQEERDAQMTNFKGAYKDYQDAEDKKYADAMKTFGQQFAADKPAAAQSPSPVSGDVKKIQTLLNNKGAKLTVDGKLGAQTLAAIVKHLESETAAPAQAAQPSAAAPRQPFTTPAGGSASDLAKNMVGNALDPWAKGGLFNR